MFVIVITIPHSKLNLRRKANFYGLTKDKAVFGATTCSNNVALVERKHHRIDGPLPNAAEQSQTSETMRDFFIETILSEQHHVQSVHEKMKIASQNSRATTNSYGTRTDTRFQCSICDESFTRKGNLVKHFRSIHGSEKKFHQCEICPYSFFYKSHLKSHVVSVHDKVRSFKCNVGDKCYFSTGRKATLKTHIQRIHEKMKPFKCDRCEFAATWQSQLKNHVQSVHEMVKNFACELCDFKSFTHATLRRHIKSVHEKLKPFKCRLCSFTTSHKNSLKKHLYAIKKKCNTELGSQSQE